MPHELTRLSSSTEMPPPNSCPVKTTGSCTASTARRWAGLTLEMGPVCGAGRDMRPMRLDRLEELELYLDGSTLEVFVNGGWATLTSRIFGAGDTLALDAFAGGAEFCPMGEFVIADARENGV